jgi:hypothetical protein
MVQYGYKYSRGYRRGRRWNQALSDARLFEGAKQAKKSKAKDWIDTLPDQGGLLAAAGFR